MKQLLFPFLFIFCSVVNNTSPYWLLNGYTQKRHLKLKDILFNRILRRCTLLLHLPGS